MPDEYPTLLAEHVHNARLFAERSDLLLALADGGTIGEIGVGLGDLSRFILHQLRPTTFVAIDRFDLHTKPNLWWKTPKEIFGTLTHQQHFLSLFPEAAHKITILQGESADCLARCEQSSFDLLYIDADHSYDSVKADIQAALPKMKPNGLLVFNDYVLHDHLAYEAYGVIRAVNELVLATDWRVTGFALQRHMYCDIALQRTPPNL